MKRFSVLCLVLIFFGLVACAPSQPPAQQESLPPAPEAPVLEPEPVELPPTAENDPLVGDEQIVQSGLDGAFGPVNAEQVITIDDVLCDASTSTLTFRFRNLDEKSWELNQQVPFPAPKDLTALRITLNNYEVNGRNKPIGPGGVNLFTQSEKFSDACQGVEVLAPGAEATCVISPIALKQSTDVAVGANEIRLNAAGADGIVRFSCE